MCIGTSTALRKMHSRFCLSVTLRDLLAHGARGHELDIVERVTYHKCPSFRGVLRPFFRVHAADRSMSYAL